MGRPMQYVATDDGIVFLAHVERIESSHSGKALLITPDQRTLVSSHSYFDLVDTLSTVIPNHSEVRGMNILDPIDEHDAPEVMLYDIIGWKIGTGDPEPITAAGVKVDFLVQSDGTVDHLNGRYGSIEQALAARVRREV